MKKIILAALALPFFSSPSMAACEGFNNALSALEAAVQTPHQSKPRLDKTSVQIRRINEAIDDVERALKEHQEKKRRAAAIKPAQTL